MSMNKNELIASLIHIEGVSEEEIRSLLVPPKDLAFADVALPCFRFAKALRNTVANRRSETFLLRWRETVRDIASSDFQKQQWARYQKRMPYARDIPFDALVGSLSDLLANTVVP